jgi:hypothetical protein
MSNALDDVVAERKRQIETEGWDTKHDDAYSENELIRAASCYVEHVVARWWVLHRNEGLLRYQKTETPANWPWDAKWWKPKDPRRDLIRAAALIVAEIERIDRRNS